MGKSQRILLLLALLEGAQGSLQEVQGLVTHLASAVRPVAAVCAAEGEDTIALVGIADVELVLHPLSAEDDLVLAAHHGHVVVKGQGIVVEVGDGVGAAADGEFAFGHLQAVGHHLREGYAQGVGIDVAGSVSAIVDPPQDGGVRRIDRTGAQRPSLAQRERLRPLDIA